MTAVNVVYVLKRQGCAGELPFYLPNGQSHPAEVIDVVYALKRQGRGCAIFVKEDKFEVVKTQHGELQVRLSSGSGSGRD